jgi:hypothetical protein
MRSSTLLFAAILTLTAASVSAQAQPPPGGQDELRVLAPDGPETPPAVPAPKPKPLPSQPAVRPPASAPRPLSSAQSAAQAPPDVCVVVPRSTTTVYWGPGPIHRCLAWLGWQLTKCDHGHVMTVRRRGRVTVPACPVPGEGMPMPTPQSPPGLESPPAPPVHTHSHTPSPSPSPSPDPAIPQGEEAPVEIAPPPPGVTLEPPPPGWLVRPVPLDGASGPGGM